jgi:stage II sporulation protein M
MNFDADKNTMGWLRRRTLRFFLFSLCLFLLVGVLSHFFFVSNPVLAREAYTKLTEILSQKINLEATGWTLFSQILLNNLRAGALFLLLGLVPFLFIPAIGIAANGMQMGLVSSITLIEGKSVGKVFLFGILPHGILEIPAVLLAGALGLHMSLFILKKIFMPQADSIPFFQTLKKTVLIWMAVVLPLLIAAAFIESFVTPSLIKSFLM